MKRIVKYKTFACSEDLEAWQAENDVIISTVSPFVSEMGGSIRNEEGEDQANFGTQVGCFVVYFDEVKPPDK